LYILTGKRVAITDIQDRIITKTEIIMTIEVIMKTSKIK
jgi:hypothetical protein